MTTKIDGTLGIVMPDNTVRASLAMIAGGFKNLQASANGISASVAITADKIALEDTNFNPIIAQNVNLTLNPASSGANGLDTGTLAASTWYSIWVISNGSTVAALASLSATAPTMPSGYTHKARVGWVRTDATGNKYPLSFIQNGRDVQYKTVVASNLLGYPKLAVGVQGTINGSTFTPVTVSLANFTPPTAAKVRVGIYQSSVAGTVALAPNSVFAGFSTANPPPMMLDNVASAPLLTASEFVLETTNLYFASTDANNFAHLMGWTDNI